MARKPTGKPRGRHKGQTRWDFDFSALVMWLFQRALDRGLTFEEAAVAVAAHPDIVEFVNRPDAGVARLTPEAIQKRFQRAIDEHVARTLGGLKIPAGKLPTYADWEYPIINASDPVDLEAYARRPRVIFKRRGD